MKKNLFSIFCSVLVLAFAFPTHAVLIYELNLTYDGASPAGNRPWLVATFENDAQVVGGVNLRLEARGLAANEFVSNWYFNIDSSYNQLLSIIPGADASPVLQNQYPAGTAEGFDIRFNFPGTDSSEALRFGAGGVRNYYFFGTNLIESNFNFQNADGTGPFYSAAYVVSSSGNGYIGTGGSNTPSAPSPVPEPATILLLGGGLMGLALIGRRLH